MKVSSETPNAVNTFNKLQLVVLFTFTLNSRIHCRILDPYDVEYSKIVLLLLQISFILKEQRSNLLRHLHNVCSIHDAGYNQFVLIRYRLKPHLKRRMHSVCLSITEPKFIHKV